MPAGDITFFNAGLEEALENWAGSDTIKIAILDNTATDRDWETNLVRYV